MPNRLAAETSPYLLQHADNPVDWYPWSDEAFALARETGKPVLLSVGYSACHWCHVMAHESFEDPAAAEIMNNLFVNIKVDREERPDIDKIYQRAYQLLTQRSGGWPLTMFLSPDTQRPFFGGTYFPPAPSHGMPAFKDLLQHVATYYVEKSDEVRSQGEQLMDVFGRLLPEPAAAHEKLDSAPLANVRAQIAQNFDAEYGGFSGAPKFPHPTTIERLMRYPQDAEALSMASLTLTRMAEGGLFDHLGGGFFRYSVDQFWQIPHFEKMLYDNGPLLAVYTQAYRATGEQFFADVANATADWMLADMVAPNGGLYSTRDADSEGEEGRFYAWTPEQVSDMLDQDTFAALSQRFGLDEEANFEGKWHLTVRKSVDEIAAATNLSVNELVERINGGRKILLNERAQRVPPERDEKQLTSWNALAIRGFAIAGLALDRDDLIDAAAGAVDFIHDNLFLDARLLAVYKDGQARFPAYLDDYAFLLDAILELLQARWNSQHLAFATKLADTLLEFFEDAENGGFWFTADDHESLMHRPKPLADDAVPSGNGIAALALQRLGFLLGETRYLDAAERVLRAAWQAMTEHPLAHMSLLNALEEYNSHPEIIVIRGEDAEISQWRRSLAKSYRHSQLIFAISDATEKLPGTLADRESVAGKTVAYRCVGTHCELPVTSLEALLQY